MTVPTPELKINSGIPYFPSLAAFISDHVLCVLVCTYRMLIQQVSYVRKLPKVDSVPVNTMEPASQLPSSPSLQGNYSPTL